MELRALKIIGRLSSLAATSGSDVLSDLTVIIKTFERQAALRRLVESITRKYPDLSIIVVDDGRQPAALDGVVTVTMPYDSGVSAERNEGLRNVRTKYFLQLDDDFVFYHHTKLDDALVLMEQFPQIDIMGGEVVNLPRFTSTDYRTAALFPTSTSATMPAGSFIGSLPAYDKVANFFIGRTERVRLVAWDPQLKRIDHADFFTRAKGVLTTVYNKNLRILHAQTPFDNSYMAKRNDFSVDQAILRRKYYPEKAAQEIVITMTGDHRQPMQFDAEYQGQSGTFDFSGRMIRGNMTSEAARQLVMEWALSHQQELLDGWQKSANAAAPDCVSSLD